MAEPWDQAPVLIVDDDPDLRESLAMVLEDAGYRVIEAGNGRAALDLLLNGACPGLILLDLMMPQMNGWEFRAAQLETPGMGDIPVVVLSASENLASKGKVFEQCASVPKPVSLDRLLEVVARSYEPCKVGPRPAAGRES